VRGKRIGVDASTQEANAALRRLVRRDSGEDYQEMLQRLARESGIETPSGPELTKRPNFTYRVKIDISASVEKLQVANFRTTGQTDRVYRTIFKVSLRPRRHRSERLSGIMCFPTAAISRCSSFVRLCINPAPRLCALWDDRQFWDGGHKASIGAGLRRPTMRSRPDR
jgi:hypothetical protein